MLSLAAIDLWVVYVLLFNHAMGNSNISIDNIHGITAPDSIDDSYTVKFFIILIQQLWNWYIHCAKLQTSQSWRIIIISTWHDLPYC